MRIARALTAAALTLGLASTLAPAHAAPAPVLAPVDVSVQAAATWAPTKLTAKAPSSKVKVGKTIKITGKLTRKGKDGYKPLAKQKVRVMFPNPDGTGVLGSGKTSKDGTYIANVKAEKWMVGTGSTVYLYFEGNSNSVDAVSKAVVLKVKK